MASTMRKPCPIPGSSRVREPQLMLMLPRVLHADGQLLETYDPVLYRLLTFPLYTIAAINGHGESVSKFRMMEAAF